MLGYFKLSCLALLLKIFISPEWIYPVAKETKNNKLNNLTININRWQLLSSWWMCKVWWWACLSVCLPASISQKSHSNLHQICGLPFAPLRYVKHFWFPGWRHIGNGQALATQKWRTLKVTHQEQHWGEVWCLRLPCHWSPFTSSSMSFTFAELHSCAGIFSHFKVFAAPVSKWSMTLSAMSTVGTHGARVRMTNEVTGVLAATGDVFDQ